MGAQDDGSFDRKTIWIVGLTAAVTMLLGTIIGIIVAGGPDDEPATAASTTTTTTTATTTTATTTATVSTAPSLPANVVAGVLAIPAAADTYVNSSDPLDAKGEAESFKIENEPLERRRALVRFQVTGLPEGEIVGRAILRLLVTDDTESPITVHLVQGDWNEATTWETAPAIGVLVAVIPGDNPEGTYVEVDVSDAVDGNGQIDFYLLTDSEHTGGFASTESGDGPTLLVAWGDTAVLEMSAGPGFAVESLEPVVESYEPVVELTGDSVLLAGAGDIADCDETSYATAALLDQTFPEGTEGIVFTTGDNAYSDGTPQEFAECYDPTWGRYKARTRPAVGNHEFGTDGASGYYSYFGPAAGDPAEGYYSYEAGPWHVVVLNSECDEVGGCGEGSPQQRWLLQDLASASSACTLAYWHHPLFSSGSHGGEDEVLPLFETLYGFGAELVLNGHDHDYERFAPQDPYGVADPETGIRQIVVGTGGKSLRGFETIVANSEARSSDAYGILRLQLYVDGYEWEFEPVPGATFTDTGTAACHD